MTSYPSRRMILLAGLGTVFVPRALPAQGIAVPSTVGPMETMRAFYSLPERGSKLPLMSARLKRLYNAQQARSRRTGDVMPGLDFDFACGCQDYDTSFRQSLQLTEISRTDRGATVSAKFKVFDRNSEIIYDLVRENGRWFIGDARGQGENAWTLSQLLQRQ
jgi:hypothetical protein